MGQPVHFSTSVPLDGIDGHGDCIPEPGNGHDDLDHTVARNFGSNPHFVIAVSLARDRGGPWRQTGFPVIANLLYAIKLGELRRAGTIFPQLVGKLT